MTIVPLDFIVDPIWVVSTKLDSVFHASHGLALFII